MADESSVMMSEQEVKFELQFIETSEQTFWFNIKIQFLVISNYDSPTPSSSSTADQNRNYMNTFNQKYFTSFYIQSKRVGLGNDKPTLQLLYPSYVPFSPLGLNLYNSVGVVSTNGRLKQIWNISCTCKSFMKQLCCRYKQLKNT